MKYDDLGQELPDPTPVEVPVGFRRPETIQEMVARAIHTHEWQKRMQSRGMETPYEADDFDVADDVELPLSPYELREMQEEAPLERRKPSAPPPAPAAAPPEPRPAGAGGGAPPPSPSTVPTT